MNVNGGAMHSEVKVKVKDETIDVTVKVKRQMFALLAYDTVISVQQLGWQHYDPF